MGNQARLVIVGILAGVTLLCLAAIFLFGHTLGLDTASQTVALGALSPLAVALIGWLVDASIVEKRRRNPAVPAIVDDIRDNDPPK